MSLYASLNMSGQGNDASSPSDEVQATKLHPESKDCSQVEMLQDPADDEVVTWLQYPLDDSFEKSYRLDFFGQWPSSGAKTPPNAEHVGTAGLPGNTGNSRGVGNVGCGEPVGSASLLRSVSAEAALTLGAERAAGLTHQAGVEAFSKVKTAMQPVAQNVGSPAGSLPKNGGSFPTLNASSSRNLSEKTLSSAVISPMLPPRTRNPGSLASKLPLQPTRGGLRNFSTFSRPLAAFRAEVSVIDPGSDGYFSKHRQDRVKVAKSISADSPFTESSYLISSDASRKDSDAHLQFSDVHQSGGSVTTEKVTVKRDADQATTGSSGVDLGSPRTNADTVGRSKATVAATQGPEKRTDVREASDAVMASYSGGSQTSADRSMKEASSSGKRKVEDSECQSEDAEGESAETKQPQKRTTSKRSRAAEIHNLSERRRRDRINEKMRALQELIPNSNKTDKASMLDEAIEYLKMLQLQLQMMSMRSGMSVSPMMIPTGMPHLQMAQMAPLHPMGMGVPVGPAGLGIGLTMGMGMGMGMGMMDMSHGVPVRPLHSLPSHPLTLNHASIPCTSTAADSENCSQASNITESPPVHFPRLQQQASPQPFHPVNMDMYNAYYFQQHQQQDQPQQSRHPSHSVGNLKGGSSNE